MEIHSNRHLRCSLPFLLYYTTSLVAFLGMSLGDIEQLDHSHFQRPSWSSASTLWLLGYQSLAQCNHSQNEEEVPWTLRHYLLSFPALSHHCQLKQWWVFKVLLSEKQWQWLTRLTLPLVLLDCTEVRQIKRTGNAQLQKGLKFKANIQCITWCSVGLLTPLSTKSATRPSWCPHVFDLVPHGFDLVLDGVAQPLKPPNQYHGGTKSNLSRSKSATRPSWCEVGVATP